MFIELNLGKIKYDFHVNEKNNHVSLNVCLSWLSISRAAV